MAEITLSDFWVGLLLSSPSDSVYVLSREEPYRLKGVMSQGMPVTPALLNRTIKTIIGTLEPDQPRLIHQFYHALRTVTPHAPVQITYKASRWGELRTATILDLGSEHDSLYVHCRSQKV